MDIYNECTAVLLTLSMRVCLPLILRVGMSSCGTALTQAVPLTGGPVYCHQHSCSLAFFCHLLCLASPSRPNPTSQNPTILGVISPSAKHIRNKSTRLFPSSLPTCHRLSIPGPCSPLFMCYKNCVMQTLTQLLVVVSGPRRGNAACTGYPPSRLPGQHGPA